MKVKNILTVLVLSFAQYVSAQWVTPSVTTPSANAASLGLYGEMPVSYYTGIADISVPLYEIKGNTLDLPISLSYYPVGLRPDLHPSWVGDGWSLQAGGAITRKENSWPDEGNWPYIGTGGYYYNYSLLNNPNWNQLSHMEQATGFAYPMANGAFEADVEPDEFDFNFLGFSGKFFLDQTGVWRVQSDKPLKVIFNPSDFISPVIQTNTDDNNIPLNTNYMTKTFGKFTIIDDHGNQYIFGGNDDNSGIEYSAGLLPTGNGYGDGFYATTWMLTQIISADGTETINLGYQRGPFTSFLTKSYFSAGISGGGSGGLFTPNCGYTGGYAAPPYSGNVVSPVYLTSISMPSKYITVNFSSSPSTELSYQQQDYINVWNYNGFTTSPAPSNFPCGYLSATDIIPYFSTHTPSAVYQNRFIWMELNSIQVLSTPTNAQFRNITLNYNNNTAQRLQLESVNIQDANSQPVQTYGFGYNPNQQPAYLSFLTDAWGFYNGGTVALNANLSNIATVRQPNASYTQNGILTSITYPTGGATTFTYEQNQYATILYRNAGNTLTSESGTAGGVRIKTITNTDPMNQGAATTRNFIYVNNYIPNVPLTSLVSSGVVDSKPLYSFTNLSGTDNTGTAFTYSFISSSPMIPLTVNSSGNFIGYTAVVEQRSDASYTIYQYTNHDNGYLDPPDMISWNRTGSPNQLPPSVAFCRGKLMQKTEYTPAGVKVQQEAIGYPYLSALSGGPTDPNGLINPAQAANYMSDHAMAICMNQESLHQAVSREASVMYYFHFLPISNTTTTYSSDGSGNSVSQAATYQYNSYGNIISVAEANSKGQPENTIYNYAPDFATSDNANPYTMMTNMNNVSTPVVKRVTVGGNLVNAELHTYSAIGPNKIYNTGIYDLEVPAPVTASGVSTTYYNPNTAQLSFDNRFVQHSTAAYDPSGNLSTTSSLGNNTAYLWDYSQKLLVAEVANAVNNYGSSSTTSQQSDLIVSIPFNNGTFTPVFQPINVGVAGTVKLTFTYDNPSVSGTTEMNYTLSGPTTASGTLCSSTATSTYNCGSYTNTVTISNVQPGTYNLSFTLTSVLGFQNYYNYAVDVNYPEKLYSNQPAQNDIGYTSFEYASTADLNYGTGNWSGINFANIKASPATAVTGNNYYTLTGTTLLKSGLQSGTTYIVSYWSDNGAYTVSGSTGMITGPTLKFGNWKYYEHTVTGTTACNIAGTGDIDELRIYPQGAQMKTYSYIPSVGLNSECDINNIVTYYIYDAFQRLSQELDKDKNILKAYNYSY
jgi:hypothetical protein